MTKYGILKNYFGYDSFREGQEALIDSILSGQDVLGIMPTGAGKSICYQVPALLLPGVTLVVSPLISLMKDQVQALNQAGIHAAYLNSSLTESQIGKALQLAAQGRYKIIYVAPERLETEGFLRFACQAQLSMLTVDEAHCISQWGQDFRPSYLKIVQFIRRLPTRPILSAFTATATEAVKDDIVCVLGLANPRVLLTGFDRANLYFAVEIPKKKDAYVLNYVQDHAGDSGIIYCATRKNVETVCDALSASGIPVTKYHAGLSNEERRQNQEDFIYDRKPVIVATNAFGMGIDKSNVRYVLHYNMPQSMENYYQEAGRAGRDGEASECILLYSVQDMVINRFLIDNKEKNSDFTQEQWAALRERDEVRLRTMERYCLTKDCLRESILRYFGEHPEGRCGNCGNCRGEFERIDVTEEAKKILDCVLETRQRYGINVVAGTLLGDNRAKLREYEVSRYQTYGSLREWSEGGVKEIIHQMLLDGLLAQTQDKYALLRATQKAQELRNGQETVIIKRKKSVPQTEQQGPHSNAKSSAVSTQKRRSDVLNSRGLELFDALRALRMEIAREENVPPYLIFSDRTLTELCVRLPFIKEELLRVSGVGEYKYEKYGERFLAQIREFCEGKKEKLYFGKIEEASLGTQKKTQKMPKTEFSLHPNQAEQFPFHERYLLTELAAAMSEQCDTDTMKKISGAEIFRYLTEQGFLAEKYINGRWTKIVPEKGILSGLYLAPRTSKKGTEYEDVYCDAKAQKMIVEHYTRER